MEDWIHIARIHRAHGFKGEFKAEPLSHDLNRYKKLKNVRLILDDHRTLDLVIESCALRAGFWYFKFQGIDAPEQGKHLHNSYMQIPASERIAAPKGQYYASDLVDLRVLDFQGRDRGRVADMLETPSVNTLVLMVDGIEVYAPWIDACISTIDLEKKTVLVNMDFLVDVYPKLAKD